MASASDRFTFILNWQDDASSLCKKFLLHCYFDNSIELIDLKTGKVFLKRVKCEGVETRNIFVADVLNIFSRRMEVIAYGDLYTQDALESVTEKTVGLIRADSMDMVINACTAIMNLGCKITKMKMIDMQTNDAMYFLSERQHESSHLKQGHLLFVGQVIVLEITGSDALAKWQDIVNTRYSAEDGNSGTKDKRVAIYGSTSKSQYQKDTDLFFVPKKVPSKISLTPTTTFKDCTLAVIKPHAVTEGTYPRIMQKILDMKFKITAVKMHHFTRSEAEELFDIYRGVLPEFKEMVDRFILGPCIGLEVSGCGSEVVSKFREAVGPRDPNIARLLRPHSIRAEFGKTIVLNGIYCTDLEEDGIQDCQYFFSM